MAHECPECGLTCHCGGDIDDLCMDIPEHVNSCNHCPDEDLDDDYYSYEEGIFEEGKQAERNRILKIINGSLTDFEYKNDPTSLTVSEVLEDLIAQIQVKNK